MSERGQRDECYRGGSGAVDEAEAAGRYLGTHFDRLPWALPSIPAST